MLVADEDLAPLVQQRLQLIRQTDGSPLPIDLGDDLRKVRLGDLIEYGANLVEDPDFVRFEHTGRSCSPRSNPRTSARSLPGRIAHRGSAHRYAE